MILDDVIWGVIGTGHCSFRTKYFFCFSYCKERQPWIFVEMNIMLLAYVIVDPAL